MSQCELGIEPVFWKDAVLAEKIAPVDAPLALAMPTATAEPMPTVPEFSAIVSW
jgi:hypothetical protein